MTGSGPACPAKTSSAGCAAVFGGSYGRRGRCTAGADGVAARAASDGTASGDDGSGGDDGGVTSAPSSWEKAGGATSPGEHCLRFLAALVSLGEGARLLVGSAVAAAALAAGLAGEAATWAYVTPAAVVASTG